VTTRRVSGAGAAKVVAATVAVAVLAGATMTGDTRRVTGRIQSVDEARVACATDGIIVDITTRLGYPPWGRVHGTGVIVDARGYVLTNNHVVAGAAQIGLRTSGGADYAGAVVATDLHDDLALVRVIGAADLVAARLGDSSALTVGQTAYAVGDGHGDCTGPQVTKGTITDLDRSASVTDSVNSHPLRLSGLITTEVTVEPGYSGGALVNDRGEVIGILAAGHVAQSCDCFSSAFAIPINRAAAIAAQMAAGISSFAVHVGPTASIGVTATGSTAPLASFVKGALVTYVAPESPADRLGIDVGDQIVGMDQVWVRSAQDLVSMLQVRRPGETVELRWTDELWRLHSGMAVLASGLPQ
jgi:S1-C subfamily serine protease